MVAGEVAPTRFHAHLVAHQRELHRPRPPSRVFEYHQTTRGDAVCIAELLPNVL
jgi:hypothetical protein